MFSEASEVCHGRTQGRFIVSATVSMSTLLAQQADITRVAERGRVLRALRMWDIEDLLVPLETGVFPSTLSAHDDADLLIDEIYYGHSSRLSPQELARLEVVATQAFLSPSGRSVGFKLECVLAVLHADRKRLERFWHVHLAKKPRRFSRDFAVAAGDLALDLDDVIEYFVAAVERAWPFDWRFRAMLALGKIGTCAGERAASSIASHIYDSSEDVSAARDRALSRIRTPSSDWRLCGFCVRGMVRGEVVFKPCPLCLGIGHVQAEQPS
jgi:hypothetical protein